MRERRPNLIERFKAWRKRRYWRARQFEHLRILITTDARWLAHDPIARALTERYESALREDWYTLPFPSADAFRRQNGLTPDYSRLTLPDLQQAAIEAARAGGTNA